MRRWRLSRRALAQALLAIGLAAATEAAASPLPVPRPERAEPPPPAPAAPSGVSGWMLVDLDSGAVLDAVEAERRFVPASVVKLVTAAYALDRLGPAHRFQTRLLAHGRLRDGVLAGDLILAGGGDPELDSDALAALVGRLADIGLARVGGRLIVDGSALPGLPAIAPDQPADASYNPGLSGLGLNFNRVRLRWGGGAARLSALGTRADPPVAIVAVRGEAGLAGPAQPSLEGGRELWRFPARALAGQGSRWLPVRRPAIYAGDALRALAATRGIALPPAEEGGTPAGARPLARLDSRPLASILADMLKYSTNLTAEMVGLAAAGAGAGGAVPGMLALSAARMNAWAARLAGLSAGDPRLNFANHSGLSLRARVAPSRMVALLRALGRMAVGGVSAHPRLPGPLAGLLARQNVAVEDEPLDHARLDVVAKTGSMDYVRGLAGYIATPGGRRLAFAIFSNDLARRREASPARARVWLARARHFERALIRQWVRRFDRPAP